MIVTGFMTAVTVEGMDVVVITASLAMPVLIVLRKSNRARNVLMKTTKRRWQIQYREGGQWYPYGSSFPTRPQAESEAKHSYTCSSNGYQIVPTKGAA